MKKNIINDQMKNEKLDIIKKKQIDCYTKYLRKKYPEYKNFINYLEELIYGKK